MRTIHSSSPPRILKEVLFRRTENDLGDLRHSPIGTQCGVTEDRNHMVFIREGAEPSIRSGYGCELAKNILQIDETMKYLDLI